MGIKDFKDVREVAELMLGFVGTALHWIGLDNGFASVVKRGSFLFPSSVACFWFSFGSRVYEISNMKLCAISKNLLLEIV